MTIKFKCEKCGKRYAVDDSKAGKKAKCQCGSVFAIPDSSEDFFIHKPTVTPGQQARFERINAMLQNERGAPVFPGPMWTYDEADVVLREPQEVARRIFALWAVSIRGEKVSLDELWGEMLDRDRVWPWTTPAERQFIEDPYPDELEAQSMVWRLESMWVLLWALGHLPELPWPDSMCDTKHMMSIIVPARYGDDFIQSATLRFKSEILDAQETTMRLHWALRQAYRTESQIPANLDWKNPTEWIAPAPTMVGRLIEERHLVLNWLIRFGNADWDDVDTPT